MAAGFTDPGDHINGKHRSFQFRISKDVIFHLPAVDSYANLPDIGLQADAFPDCGLER
jgi:hypothetical protein